jgi:two-component system alkaline phosphatase synthesis response regulator PhoP
MENQVGVKKILLIDDDPDILEIISYNLKKEGFEVETAENGRLGIDKAKSFLPDLIVLDVMMPEMDGIEVCEIISKTSELQHVVITFLTARGEDYSQIAGFDAGADDYISKPIKPKVLVSRIKALLKRVNKTNISAIQHITVAGLTIDKEQYLVFKEDQEFSLPKKEFELLALLFSKPGKVFTREVIMNSIWGNDVVVGDRTIDVHVRKLREKIGDDFIRTIKGVGYKLEA